ncbi:hypothetical protein SK224_04255 [Microbacterium sp. BG28]|uniref:DUF7507 domain-containing protein n=1 Tax=Microbacterium sp. BG28 TaxID=3097356 RepID=UPI002A5A9701|nr:hypothetical protein [Microbacterium sp. BG28]MDY0828335.1 hypothetical protein [Microbacterium sp. BG28]
MSIKKLSAAAGAAALLAAVFTGMAAVPATAAPIEGSCGYANSDGGGKFPDSICWLDFAGYDSSVGLSGAGQEFELSLGAYDVSYTVTERPISGYTARSVAALPATNPPFVIGVPGYYEGIPGKPFLYASTGQPFGAVEISISDFEVSIGGTPVTGYELVAAAPETQDAISGNLGEWINMRSDAPLTLIDHSWEATTGGCALPPVGDGTTNLWCNAISAGGTGAYGSIFSAPSATRISGALYMNSRGEREGLGFGIRTARVSVDKQVDSRVASDDAFDISVASSEGPLLASATTGATDAASTGLVPVIPSGAVTLAEASSTGAQSPIDYYDADWSCTNANATSTTVLPEGSGASQPLSLVAGDAVSCTVTNTAKAAALSLEKSVSPATAAVGDTVIYDFAVTNDGDLPVEALAIDETAFSGSGQLGQIVCPVTELAVGASTTCQAPYVVTQADVDAGGVSNEAVATALIAETTVESTSASSKALLAVEGESALAVTKTASVSQAVVGDTVDYTLTATNTGALTLSNVTLADTDFSGSAELGELTCDKAAPVMLAPGDVLTCTVSYETRAADVGTLSNGAAGSAVDPRDNVLTDSATAAVTVVAPAVVPVVTPPAATASHLAITGTDLPGYAAGFGAMLLLAGAVMMIVRRTRRS